MHQAALEQIDGGFCHGLVVSWWLGWLDTAVSGGEGGVP